MDSSNQSNTITLQPGEFMIREKTVCDALYIVKEGQLEVFRTTPNGEKIPLGLISSGQYVGETALLSGRTHSSNVVALTPVKAIRLTKTAIEAQLEKVPGWLVALTKGKTKALQLQETQNQQYKIKCPECAGALAFMEGCVKCNSCGFSQC